MKTAISLILFLFFGGVSFAQSSDSSLLPKDSVVQKKAKTTFTMGVDFYSHLHYYGRTDSLRSTAWVPNVFLQLGNGIFLNSSLIFINNSGQSLQYTAATLGGGYKFGKPGKIKGWAGSVYASKFFYSNNILVQSSQEGQAGFTLNYLNKIATINFGSSVAFGSQSDFFANSGFDHLFKWRSKSGKNIFAVLPAISLNAGTQNFTNIYYQHRIFPLSDSLVTETSKRFKILSVEISAPFVFIHNKLAFTFTPGVVLPQNVIKVAGRPDLSERASNLFYANLGVLYTFGKK